MEIFKERKKYNFKKKPKENIRKMNMKIVNEE